MNREEQDKQASSDLSKSVSLLGGILSELKSNTGMQSAASAIVSATSAAATVPIEQKPAPKGESGQGFEKIVPNYQNMSDDQIRDAIMGKAKERREERREERKQEATREAKRESINKERDTPRSPNVDVGPMLGMAPRSEKNDGYPAGDDSSKWQGPRKSNTNLGDAFQTPKTYIPRRNRIESLMPRSSSFARRAAKGAGKGIGRSLKSAFGKSQAGRAVSGLGKNLRTIQTAQSAGAVGLAAARAVPGLGILATVAIGAGKALKSFADSALEANRKYADSSAAMALVFAKLDIQRTFRNIETGNRLAPSAGDLANSQDFFENNTIETETAFGRVKNWLGTAINFGLATSGVVQTLEFQARTLNLIAEGLKRDEGRPATFGDIVAGMAEQGQKDHDEAVRKMQDEKRRWKPGPIDPKAGDF